MSCVFEGSLSFLDRRIFAKKLEERDPGDWYLARRSRFLEDMDAHPFRPSSPNVWDNWAAPKQRTIQDQRDRRLSFIPW